MKSWDKPTLIVLVRGTSQETVLTICKALMNIWDGPSTEFMMCTYIMGCMGCEEDDPS